METCRWDGEGVGACMSVLALGAGYPEAQIVIDWPGRTVMQIHSSRLMFCHSALSAIKLAPVLKSPADNVAEAEITLHFPSAFLHLRRRRCRRHHSDIYFMFSDPPLYGNFPGIVTCLSSLIYNSQLILFILLFFHAVRRVVFKSMLPLKVFNHFLVVDLPQN